MHDRKFKLLHGLCMAAHRSQLAKTSPRDDSLGIRIQNNGGLLHTSRPFCFLSAVVDNVKKMIANLQWTHWAESMAGCLSV